MDNDTLISNDELWGKDKQNAQAVVFAKRYPFKEQLFAICCGDGATDALDALLHQHPNMDVNVIDRNDFRPLHHAAAQGHLEAVQWLLDHGADPTKRVRNNRSSHKTPLEYAAYYHHTEVVRLLSGLPGALHCDEPGHARLDVKG